MTSGLSCDSNILIYSIDTHDRTKHLLCRRIVDNSVDAGIPVALQCLNEFFRASTRKNMLSINQAKQIVERFQQSFDIFECNERDTMRAIEIFRSYPLQFFDALIVACMERAGCTTLLSEDMQHGRRYGEVTILNPFKLTGAELDLLLA